MRVIVYCMESQAKVVWQATKTHPVTCPPFTADTFDARVFAWADVIWLGLHGIPQDPDHLYGDESQAMPFPIRVKALDVAQLTDLDLTDKVVYATTCHFTATKFPMVLKARGARVIGGPGENYGRRSAVAGADKLGAALLYALRDSVSVACALNDAKRVLDDSKADADAREFTVL